MKLKLGLSYFAVFLVIVLTTGLFSVKEVKAGCCVNGADCVDFGDVLDSEGQSQQDQQCVSQGQGWNYDSICECKNSSTTGDTTVNDLGNGSSTPKSAKTAPTCSYNTNDMPGGLFSGISQNCVYCGDCKICDFLTVANNLAKIIFSIMGAVAFAMFMWGGTGFISAGGDPEKIKASKDTIVAVIWGLVIIVLAWQLVHVVIVFLQPGDPVEQLRSDGFVGQLFSRPWDDPKCE
ncbi:MAG: pilin [Patescibacteria group bacterium]